MNQLQEGLRTNLIEASKELLEERFREKVWKGLRVNCENSKMSPCHFTCIKPCKMADEFIKTAVLLYWNEYVRMN